MFSWQLLTVENIALPNYVSMCFVHMDIYTILPFPNGMGENMNKNKWKGETISA